MYFTAAVVTDSRGRQYDVKCSSPLDPKQANLLFALGEHVNNIIPTDDLCHRLKISVGHLRVVVCMLRKRLHYDWVINAVPNKGFRLCYLGGGLSRSKRTSVVLGRRGPAV